MKTERSPHTNNKAENTITDQNLAWEMAHGGKAHRDLAARAIELGLLDKAQELRAGAEAAEHKAGEAHIDSLKAQLGETTSTPESETSHEQGAEAVIAALETKFPDHTFELIADTVMCTDPNGIDLGNPNHDYDSARSWNSVMADESDERFIVTIDGVDHDSRAGMTFEAYEAMIAAKKEAGEELPDSKANRLDNGWYTRTLMTGEKADADADVAPIARVARVYGGGLVRRRWVRRDSGIRYLRVRPAVKISLPKIGL